MNPFNRLQLVRVMGFFVACTFYSDIVTALADPIFVTQWDTRNTGAGTSCGACITIPVHPGSSYNYDVDWDNNGTFDDLNVSGSIMHDYGVPGIKTVTIRGAYPRIYFKDHPDRIKLTGVIRWGETPWTSVEEAFDGCINLTGGSMDEPDLSKVKSTRAMFRDCEEYNDDLDDWDVSLITDMSEMFRGAESFNGFIKSWDVTSVVDMSRMFLDAKEFNTNIAPWQTIQVKDMSAMFSGADDFNQPLTWIVGSAQYMDSMFHSADSFNQSIDSWNVSAVTDMSHMFHRASSFDQDLNSWDVSNVVDMSWMFEFATSFNGEIGDWLDEPSKVNNMSRMFRGASSFRGFAIGDWDVGSVTNMSRMFENATTFLGALWFWDVSSVTDMSFMFRASGYSRSINSWSFNSIEDMTGMLDGTSLSFLAYENLLESLASQNLPDELNFGAAELQYCETISRDFLSNVKNWTITGDSPLSDNTRAIYNLEGNGWNNSINWNGGVPTVCHGVIIESDILTILFPFSEAGVGRTLEVKLGAVLDVRLGSQLIIGQ